MKAMIHSFCDFEKDGEEKFSNSDCASMDPSKCSTIFISLHDNAHFCGVFQNLKEHPKSTTILIEIV